MAMTTAGMQAAIKAALDAEFGADYDNIPDDHELNGYDYDTYKTRFARALANGIVPYIQANANAVGTDTPSGDSHNLTIT